MRIRKSLSLPQAHDLIINHWPQAGQEIMGHLVLSLMTPEVEKIQRGRLFILFYFLEIFGLDLEQSSQTLCVDMKL